MSTSTLIQSTPSKNPCSHHAKQQLPDLYNDPSWQAEVIEPGKIKFTCLVCSSVRVYKLSPERTLL